jgi:predicted ATPase
MVYRFSNCEVDTKLLELRRDGEPRSLDPLEFDLLVYLIENRDRVLTRDELMDALWPGRIVTDSALSSRLKAVRAAVGDSGKAQEIIRTAHGRGYRFVADIDGSQPEATATRDAPAVPATSAVGRDAELGMLTRWLERAVTGSRAVVLICGEAGVGKTTLTRAFIDQNRTRNNVLIMHGQCVNQRGASEPYLPLLEAFARAGQGDPSVSTILRQHAPAWLLQLPSLQSGRVDSLQRDSVGTTSGRMHREIADALDVMARERTIILVLEDLHWSDPSTIEWLDYFAHRSNNSRLMLVATGRPDGPQQPVFRELALREHAHSINLQSIDEASISDYLAHRLEQPPVPELAALTYQRTNGFPLFIDALLTHWLHQGLIEKSGGNWHASAADEVLLEGVPEDLAQLIEQQLAGLDDQERQLLETGALAGARFAAAAVAYALGEDAEKTEALYGRLARQARVVRNAGEVHWPDNTVTATFEFRHELYREALYDSVPASRRARLHAALGERLEQAYGDEAEQHAGQIADHFARAHEVGRALKYFYPAALKAFNRSANREAQALLNRAIGLIATLPESEESLRVERELHLLRASAYISLEGWASDDVERSYRRAREIADQLGMDGNSIETLGLASMEELRGHYKESQIVLETLLDDPSMLGLEAHELLACSLFHQGEFAASMKNADQAISQYDPAEISSVLARYGENPGVCCHGWAALDLWFLGYPDTAVERSENALKLAAEHIYSHSTALTHRTFLHQFRNEPAKALEFASRTIEVASAQGFGFRIAQTSIIGAWAKACLAESAQEMKDALQQIDSALEDYASMGAEMDVPYYLTLKADVLKRLGRVEDALQLQDEALSMTGDGRAFFYEPEMHRLRAELLLAQDEPRREEAADAIRESLEIARRTGARMLELRTCVTRLAMLDDVSDDSPEKKDLLQVMNSLSEGQNAPDWQSASGLN